MKLIIVESPTKCKTITNYLKGFVVKASMGHIKDLPKSRLGVDIDNDFKPHYIILSNKRKILKEIIKTAEKAKEIFIATDPDREGEAIAFHLKEEIKKDAKRVLFFEMTKDGIKEGMSNPLEIDTKKVESQRTRRILDRLVGYLVSPLLWKAIKKGLSAGRVQSAVLRILCEREDEIEKFLPEKYYVITGEFEKNKERFKGKLVEIDGKKVEIKNKEDALRILNEIKGEKYNVLSVSKKVKRQFTLPPLITSTLEREAATRYKFSTKKTMIIAQQLYEGIDLEKGTVGLITYMRTDSVRLSEKALNDIRNAVKKNYGNDYLPEKPNIFKEKKTTQGAHEAIRPTFIEYTPDSLRKFLTQDQYKIYKLIWERAVASQMKPAEWENTIVKIKGGKFLFEASSRKLIFDGFLKVLGIPKEEVLPELSENESVNLIEVNYEEKETQPPPRYTEGTIVKKMEDVGIGRPSTYAPTISLLIERGYVKSLKGVLYVQELGRIVNSILLKYFKDLFDVKFTSVMEEELDEIEEGNKESINVIDEFYAPFEMKLKEVTPLMTNEKKEYEKETDIKCNICGRPMVIKWGRFGKFLACSGYPECKNTKRLNNEDKSNEIVKDRKCPKCGSDLVIKNGKYGRFIACSRYPECDFTDNLFIDSKCPKCGSPIIERKSKKGRTYYVCSNQDCKTVFWNKPLNIECPVCSSKYLLLKKSKSGEKYCPVCKKYVDEEINKRDSHNK